MSVQSLSFGQSLPGSGSNFLRLKIKGEKVQFRIAQEPVYDGKHFIQLTDPDTKEAKWQVTECSRIASGEECAYCEQYFELMAHIKKFKLAEGVDDEHPEVKRMKTEAGKNSVNIQWYFPILNRADGKFAILQTTNGVRNKFNAQFANGIDVMSKEWVLSNTGSPSPAERYSISLVDSADVKKFSPEEELEWEKARSYDLSQISHSGGEEE